MNHMGKKARTVTTGAWRPIATTTKPSVAAMLYAGAVEATAMTMLEIRPSAPVLRPFSGARLAGSTISATLPPETSTRERSCSHLVQNLIDTIARFESTHEHGSHQARRRKPTARRPQVLDAHYVRKESAVAEDHSTGDGKCRGNVQRYFNDSHSWSMRRNRSNGPLGKEVFLRAGIKICRRLNSSFAAKVGYPRPWDRGETSPTVHRTFERRRSAATTRWLPVRSS